MTGLTPVSRVAFQSWTAPAIDPWSVRLTDGISSSAARATRSEMRHAPSRIEYSEWTWRWTKSAWAIAGGSVYAGVLTPQPRAPGAPERAENPLRPLCRNAQGRPAHDRYLGGAAI